ncbi:MAG: 4'-phosphopantetheinyl transferase superfamily protein [Prochlorococcaceae cyanobacterium ETNP1_MAG_9]|nr:4'-phosphopantetheinyl transferase superfamily protein [Prochlorococcaceae cyanobacterium ETNP1_MAG_9]
MQAPLQTISSTEQIWALELSGKRSREYQHSRGYIRQALSELWQIPALNIPLYAPPGKSPQLSEGWGHISISHCFDALFIGWSPKRIGVDIERIDRRFNPEKLAKRYFSKKEIDTLNDLRKEDLRIATLKNWVIKEAAIKWQQASLAGNISEWSFCKTSNLMIHASLGHKIGLHRIEYDSWYIAITYDHKFHLHAPIACLN